MLKLACINIERSKHLARVAALVEREKPDVACLQEVCQRDLPFLMNLVGPYLAWVPMSRHPAEVEIEVMGVAIVSRYPLNEIRQQCFRGDLARLPTFEESDDETIANNGANYSLLTATLQLGETVYQLGTTHFPVTYHGSVTPEQLRNVRNFMQLTAGYPEMVFCGDFNAPRGREAFGLLAARYRDNIPAHYTGSLDPVLHTRAGHKPFMVDGLFSTPGYRVSNVQLHQGVSDHQAITAEVYRA